MHLLIVCEHPYPKRCKIRNDNAELYDCCHSTAEAHEGESRSSGLQHSCVTSNLFTILAELWGVVTSGCMALRTLPEGF